MYKFVFTSKETLRMFVELLEEEELFELEKEWSSLYNKVHQDFPSSFAVDNELQITKETSSNVVEFIFQSGVREIRNEKQDLISKMHFLDSDPSIWNLLNNIKSSYKRQNTY